MYNIAAVLLSFNFLLPDYTPTRPGGPPLHVINKDYIAGMLGASCGVNHVWMH